MRPLSGATYEDLGTFEYDAASLDRTAKAWQRVLAAWNITSDPAAIRRVLQPYAGTRSPPAPHAATIENAAEVGAALRKVGLSQYFRG